MAFKRFLKQRDNLVAEEPTAEDTVGEITEETEEDGSFLINQELRTIYLFGLFNTKLTMRFIKHWDTLTYAYNQLNIRRDPITIVINSGGGNCYDGLALYDKIKSSGIPTKTVCIGKLDSAAIAVFLAGSERAMHENAFIGFHQTQPPDCSNSDRVDVEREIRECRKIDSRYRRIILEYSNLCSRTINRFEQEQRELTAEEALKFGLATEIIRNH